MKIVKAHQTSYACPSQWDAWDEKGNYWYFRLRHGYLEATQMNSSDDRDWSKFPEIELDVSSEGYDGVASLGEFCNLAGIELASNVEETSVYE